MEANWKYFFSGLLVCGLISFGLTKPADNQQEYDYEMQGDDDYAYDDGDENLSQVNEKLGANIEKPTIPPIFEIKNYAKHVHPGSDVSLECPIQNLGSTNVVIWFNKTQVLSQNRQSTSERLISNNNNTLIIKNVTKYDDGDYICQVLPNKISLHVKLHVSKIHNHPHDKNMSESLEGRRNYETNAIDKSGTTSLVFQPLSSFFYILLLTQTILRISYN